MNNLKKTALIVNVIGFLSISGTALPMFLFFPRKPKAAPNSFQPAFINNKTNEYVEVQVTFEYLASITTFSPFGLSRGTCNETIVKIEHPPILIKPGDIAIITPEEISKYGHQWKKSHAIGITEAKVASNRNNGRPERYSLFPNTQLTLSNAAYQ